MTQPQPSSLLVVGSVAIDDLDGPFGRHPDVLGGSASFISLAASLLAPRAVKLVAVVGEDFPAEHVTLLRDKGVDVTGLERVRGKTFRWVGRYADDLASRQTLDTQLGVFADFRPKLGEQHRGAELVFLGNIDPVLQLDVLEQCKRPALVAMDTMNFWIGGKPAELARTLARIDLLLVNDEEARQLAGEHNLVRAASAVRRMGPKGVIIKRGDAGALLFHEHGVFAAPAFPLEVVKDPTGAGDTFAGGFMGYLARAQIGRRELTPHTFRHAMIAGSVLASFCVEDFSVDRLRALTLDEVAHRFKLFYDLTNFDAIEL
jgi:sugar/nucleoside kinase (ribokinase family)